jgi:hypothetical protein
VGGSFLLRYLKEKFVGRTFLNPARKVIHKITFSLARREMRTMIGFVLR